MKDPSAREKFPRINTELVSFLVRTQFPEWSDLAVEPVAKSGMSNASFHLGRDLVVRLPRNGEKAVQLETEFSWVPRIAGKLPVPISRPIRLGEPAFGYPWRWAVYGWVEGDVALPENVPDTVALATDLACFLRDLQELDTSGGPMAGARNNFRGCSLTAYDDETRKAVDVLAGRIDAGAATDLWETALHSEWEHPPVWIHGDVSAENLLVRDGRLRGVIDFGNMGVGDPACDLAMCWNVFEDEGREAFRSILPLDPGTWARGRGWVLWKALILAADLCEGNAYESTQTWAIIEKALKDHMKQTN